MLTATLTDDGHVAIPEAIRRQYGLTGGVTCIFTPLENGIMFSFSETKPIKRNPCKKTVENWEFPVVDLGGPPLVPIENLRDVLFDDYEAHLIDKLSEAHLACSP